MSSTLLRARHIREIPWRDLVALRPAERWRELLLPIPFLVAAWTAFALDSLPFVLIGSAYFFLAGLRVVHDAFHGNLALSRRTNDLVLLALSGLMLGSMHAVRLTHLQHHRDCLGPGDVEGNTARRSALGAIAAGAAFPFALHRAAWRLGDRVGRRWIAAELALTIALVLAAVFAGLPPLTTHVVLMLIAQALTGFFAVWTVHHDVDPDRQLARTLRHRVKSAAALGMFFHLEHHLFPTVPTCHLPTLADRLERAAPELSKAKVY
jgi:fatty acid desaturase